MLLDSPDYSAIIEAIESMKDSHNKCMVSLRNEVKVGLKGSAIQIEAEMSVINAELKRLVTQVLTQNSDVKQLQEESNKRVIAVQDFRRLEGRLKWLKKKWVAILFGFVVLITAIVVIIDLVGVRIIVESIWEKIP